MTPRRLRGRKAKQHRKPPTHAVSKRTRRRKVRHKPVIPQPRVGEVERVIALDSSSRACGWSVFDNGQLVAQGCYAQVGHGHGERLAAYRQWLLQLLADWKPDRLIYEAPYQGRMRYAFGILSRYVGLIEAAHFEHFQREIDKDDAVAAHRIKKVLRAPKGADHDDNKVIMLGMINEAFNLHLDYTQNDIADAIALNWAWHLMREDGRAAEDADE